MLVHCRYIDIVIYHEINLNLATVCNHISDYSDGVGRTGIFICMDIVHEQIKRDKVVDIPGAINKLRQQRYKMVETFVCITIVRTITVFSCHWLIKHVGRVHLHL